MPDLRAIGTSFIIATLIALGIFGVGLAVEHVAPAQRQQVSTSRLNIGYAIFVVFVQSVITAIPVLGIKSLGGGLIALPSQGWAVFLSIMVYVVAIDFAHFLYHRAQHAWPILWAMHSLHHTDRTVNVTTTLRHHWSDILIELMAIYPFVAFIFGVPSQALIANALISYYNYFVHCNVRISFGRLAIVLNCPQYHRLHHSDAAGHRDKNFAALFPVFDVIFGSFQRPATDEYPATGIKEQPGPSRIFDAMMWPFLRSGLGTTEVSEHV